MVPPPRLVLNCIGKIEKEKADCTLIIPEWKSAPFRPLLFGARKMSENSISEIVQLPRGNVIDVGFGNNGIFQNNPLSFRKLAIRFKF